MTDKSHSILLVDDEAVLRQILRARLAARGYLIYEAGTGEDALQTVPVLRPDVIVLDIGLPDIDGIDVTRRLRPSIQTPIIMLSVRATESDKIAALDAGAYDYLTKPCDLGELLDRIRTVLSPVVRQESGVLVAGDLQMDLNLRTVHVANTPVGLTAYEYELLKVFILNAGRLLTQSRLAQEVWGDRRDDIALQMLRITISALREKLDADPAHSGHIATEPGVGYRLRIAPSN